MYLVHNMPECIKQYIYIYWNTYKQFQASDKHSQQTTKPACHLVLTWLQLGRQNPPKIHKIYQKINQDTDTNFLAFLINLETLI